MESAAARPPPRWRHLVVAAALLLGPGALVRPPASFADAGTAAARASSASPTFAGAAKALASRARAHRAPRRAEAALLDAHASTSTSTSTTTTSTFAWGSQWYPVAVAADLDPKAPHAVTLLGEDLALWHDGVSWACVADRCPHRLAPLSEGRLQSQQGPGGQPAARLQCAYHGWEFDRQGACLRIPQSGGEDAEASATRSSRSCVKAYPVGEAAGLLWVWPDDAAGAAAEAARTPLPLPASVKAALGGESGQTTFRGFFMRDLPYGHDILLENLVDPSHLPFSHHGVGSLRREGVTAGHRMEMVESAAALRDSLRKEHSAAAPALQQVDRLVADSPTALARTKSPFGAPDNMAGFVHFTAPSRVVYEYPGGFSIALFATPTKPGAARVFLANLPPPAPAAGTLKQTLMRRLFRTIFMLKTGTFLGRYRSHMLDHTIFDGDGIFLASQQHKLHQEDAKGRVGGGTWKSYFTPAPADSLVVAMRRWYEGHGGGQPPWRGAHVAREAPPPAALASDPAARRQLLDRWQQHTRFCRVCLAAHQRLSAASVAASAVLACSLAWWCGGVGAGVVAPLSATSARVGVVAGAAAVARRWLREELQSFHFVDYVHAHK